MTFLLGLQYFHKWSKTHIDILASSGMYGKGIFSAEGRGGKADGPATRTKTPSVNPNHNSPSVRQIIRQGNYCHWK